MLLSQGSFSYDVLYSISNIILLMLSMLSLTRNSASFTSVNSSLENRTNVAYFQVGHLSIFLVDYNSFTRVSKSFLSEPST